MHTDDTAWWYSRFDWAELLKRQGAIEVPLGYPLLIIEGVGATRRECAHLIDAAMRVQTDERETERRSLARVG